MRLALHYQLRNHTAFCTLEYLLVDLCLTNWLVAKSLLTVFSNRRSLLVLIRMQLPLHERQGSA